MLSGLIYEIINCLNNKVYVGMTTLDINRRWIKHKTAHKSGVNMILYKAMDKYGLDNFKINILESNISNDKLCERERYWIKEKNSLSPNGYNNTRGGLSLEGDENPFYGKEHSTETRVKMREIALNRDMSRDGNPFYGKEHSINSKLKISKGNSKGVIAYDDNGDIIKEFKSGTLASEWCISEGLSKSKYSNSDISKSCNNGNKAFGLYWRKSTI